MKFKLKPIKKYLYLANDITSILLKKNRDQTQENFKKLRIALIVVSIILALSLVLNFYLYLNR